MKEIHGLAGVVRVAMLNSNDHQQVKVTDGDRLVLLALSTSSFPAGLTPDEAEFLARQLVDSARRVRGQDTKDSVPARAAGGKARAAALSPERRSEIAKAASRARWAEGLQRDNVE